MQDRALGEPIALAITMERARLVDGPPRAGKRDPWPATAVREDGTACVAYCRLIDEPSEGPVLPDHDPLLRRTEPQCTSRIGRDAHDLLPTHIGREFDTGESAVLKTSESIHRSDPELTRCIYGQRARLRHGVHLFTRADESIEAVSGGDPDRTVRRRAHGADAIVGQTFERKLVANGVLRDPQEAACAHAHPQVPVTV